MARVAISVTLGQALPSGTYNTSAGGVASVSATLVTAVQDAMDVLQADGATPTEAHVDTADAAWTAAKAALTAVQAPNLVIEYDDSVITSKNKLRAALNRAANALINRGLGD